MAKAPSDATRIHYLDNLRALAMLLGVVGLATWFITQGGAP